MGMKKEAVYRKAKREDFPAIVELIRQKNLRKWECEKEKTEKRLSRLLFYRYMSCMNTIFVAVCRDKIVGVIISGYENRKRFMPAYRIKTAYILLRLKMTKEGRANLRILRQLKETREKLQDKENRADHFIQFLYVHKNFLRNGIGTGLLNLLQETEKETFFVYADQSDNLGFMEKHGFVKLADTEQMMEIRRQRFREKISLYQIE